MKPFLQTNLKVTKSQFEFFTELTSEMSYGSILMFRHTLICQLQQRFKSDYPSWAGVPIARTFIHKKCRGYHWDEVKHLMRRPPYNPMLRRSFRYRIHDEIVDKFVQLGEDYLLSRKAIISDGFYDISGKSLVKLIKPFSDNPSTPVNVEYGIKWLREEKEWLDTSNAPAAEKEKRRRAYLNNLYCFKAILERATAFNYKTGFVEYSQQLSEPDKDLRKYEVGGGLQCTSKEFREYLLFGSPVINIDAVKCHATIAHEEMSKLGIDSGLTELLEGKATIPGSKLYPSTIKTAMLAVLNGARPVKKLTKRYTLPSLVMNDPFVKPLSEKLQLRELDKLTKALNKQVKAVRLWVRKLTPHPRIQTVSASLQKKETELLSPLKAIACNDQHDGALILLKDAHLLETLDSGYLHLEPKPINPNPTRDPHQKPIQTGMRTRHLLASLPSAWHHPSMQGTAPKNTLTSLEAASDNGFDLLLT